MSDRTPARIRTTLDKDLDKFTYVEEATSYLSRSYVTLGFGVLFLVLVGCLAALLLAETSHWFLLTAAVVLGGYMALNIGANDVANNMGPAVGARVLTMGSALVLAALCESAGALLAGSGVVSTISSGIVSADQFARPQDFPLAMLAALVAAALWINLATMIGAPVSTTHAVVGAVVGAGLVAAGTVALDGLTLTAIAAGWLVSPVLGGVAAALLLAFIKTFILRRSDRLAAARRWLPAIFAAMAGTFTLYLILVGLPALRGAGALPVLGLGAVAAGLAYAISRPAVRRAARGLDDRNQSLRHLFRPPLVVAAAILSFAHGANDVANAVGPVAAIFSALGEDGVGAPDGVLLLPVLVVGALGISLGLLLFGPRLVRMVGERITRLNPIRAFCVLLATAATVLLASAAGLPISSTHTAVGAVFGVGFYREWYMNRERRARAAANPADLLARPEAGEAADIRRRMLVRRAHVLTIVSAWMVTVPASGSLAVLVWFVLSAAL